MHIVHMCPTPGHAPKFLVAHRAGSVHTPGMVLDAPLTIPGHRLRAQREGYGVTRQALAAKLQHHRNTLLAWEQDPEVDVRRQRLYLAALRELVGES